MRFNRGLVRGMIGAALVAFSLVAAAPFVQHAVASAQKNTRTFEIDPIHSMVMFRIGHLGVSYTYGRFNEPTGAYNIDVGNPSASFINITLDATKVDTANERRDNHLRSPDFFNAKQFPTITFKSTSFEKSDGNSMKVRGQLTMLDVTRDVEATLEYIGEADTRQGYKSGFEANFKIIRSEFGMDKYLEGNALGDEVTLNVTIEGARKD